MRPKTLSKPTSAFSQCCSLSALTLIELQPKCKEQAAHQANKSRSSMISSFAIDCYDPVRLLQHALQHCHSLRMIEHLGVKVGQSENERPTRNETCVCHGVLSVKERSAGCRCEAQRVFASPPSGAGIVMGTIVCHVLYFSTTAVSPA